MHLWVGCLQSLTMFWKLLHYFFPAFKLFLLEKKYNIQKNFEIQPDLGGPPGTLHESL